MPRCRQRISPGPGLAFSTRGLAALLVSMLLISSGLGQDQRLTEQELNAVDGAIADIEVWLGEANSQHSEVEQQLREADLALAETARRVATLQDAVATTEDELERLRDRQVSLEAERAAQLEQLAGVMRALYIVRNEHPLKVMLNQDDASEAARMLYYSRIFTRRQLDQIDNFETTLAELASTDQSLASELDRLSSQRQTLEAEADSLGLARSERRQALAALTADIGRRNAELEQLQSDRAQLESLLQEIARAMEGVRSFDDVPPFAAERGRLPMPARAAIRSRFGSTYAGGSLQRQGIILASEAGSPVQAVHAGRVVFADWLRGAGLLVIIDHGNGYVSLYGANEALATEAGAWVDAGTVIATSGGAGPDGQPGLYFEIREHGAAIDPGDWLEGPR